MLRLNLKREASWVELGHGVRLKCDPLSTAVMAAAKRDFTASGIGEDLDKDDLGIAMAKAVARRVVVEWEGVADEEGDPAEVTPEGIDALLDIWVMFDAFQNQYLASGFLLDQEKNGSAPSPDGTSAGATATARPARASARSARPKSTRR
jgi:hypothetical protein